MLEITDLIKKRVSCRTYADKPVETEVLRKFSRIVAADHTGPFGNQPKFQLINLNMSSPQEWKKLGTYGVIKNARFFLVGKIIKSGDKAMEDYGYCKEKLILQATKLGLGTCWLGGTFNAGGFARAVGLRNDEVLPTVSPIGYPADQRSLTERIMRRFAGSNNRRPWADIFFAGNFSTSLNEQQAGKYAQALANVRLAPSASNKQPWRILYDGSRNIFHFYLARAFGYEHLREVSLQDIDLGIAMSHFDLTIQELGLQGKWQVNSSAPQEKALEYIATWQKNI
jgi:nitroreductase